MVSSAADDLYKRQPNSPSALKTNGADPNTRDKWGNTPLDVTLSADIEALLRQHGGKTAEALTAAGS